MKLSDMNFSKLVTIALIFLLSCSFNESNNTEKSHLKLWYKQPADASVKDLPDGWKNDDEWLKALPLGKVRKVEGTTFPTWLDANKLAPLKIINNYFNCQEKNQ